MSMYIAHMSNTTEWIAAAIRHALLDAGRTKRAVADETGIPYPTLNRKISGKRDFTLSELLSIAEATNTHPAAFIPPQFRGRPHGGNPVTNEEVVCGLERDKK